MDRIRCGLFSAKTNIPYRAGKLAAERIISQTNNSNPALCLVFFSERYADQDLVDALAKVLNPEIIAGCSTNGEIADGYWRESVVVYSLSTDYIRFGIAVESNENLASGSDEVYRNFYNQALEDLRKKIIFQEHKLEVPVDPNRIVPDFGLTFLPGTDIESRPRSNEVLTNLRKFLGDLPLIGGTIGDDFNYTNSYVIFKDELLENHTILILAKSDLEFSMAQTHGYHAKEEYTLTDVDYNTLLTLDNKSAAEVYFGNLNLPVVEISDLRDEICALNPLGVKDSKTNELQILFPMSRGKNASDLTISQTLKKGEQIYFTEADLELSKKASLESIKTAFSTGQVQDPRVGLLFSCVGRSTFYFDQAQAEIEEIKKRFKYTDLGGAYLYGTNCGLNSFVSEGTTSTLLIGNDIRKKIR